MHVQDFVRDFAPRLRAGDAAVVCGAGISVPSNLPDWEALLEKPREELGLDKSFSDLSLLAAYYVSEVPGGRTRITRWIREQLSRDGFTPNAIHHLLWHLPVPYLWSLNFDDLLEKAHAADKGHLPRVIQSDEEMTGSLSRSGCTLVKMHGSINDIESSRRRLVLTRDDFDAYITDYPRTWARLLADFYTKSILFVGISFADPNMQTLLRLVRTGGQKSTQRHYSIVRKIASDLPKESAALSQLQRADLQRGGVESVEVESFDELPDLLRSLAIASRPDVVMISGSLATPGEATNLLLQSLGTRLATLADSVGLVYGGSDSISVIAHRFAEQLERDGRYDDSRVLQVRRSEPHGREAVVTERRLGTILFPGVDASAVRRDLCSRARVCVVVGGGTHTKAEVDECRLQGVPVIPVPVGVDAAGKPLGFSETLWAEMSQGDSPSARRLARFANQDPIVLSELVIQAVRDELGKA